MAFRTRATDPTSRPAAAARGPAHGPRTGARGGTPGFTLAESLIASVVLALAVVGVAGTLTAAHRQTEMLERESQAIALARQLIEEIAAKPLVSSDPTPGWSAGQHDRAMYDTVNDYDGYTDQTPVPTIEGAAADVAGATRFQRLVTLRHPALLFGTAPVPGEFVVVEVKVRDALGDGCELRRLVSRTNLKR